MKGTYLGEFQEVVLLIVLILEPSAYGVLIQEEIGRRAGREVSRGALHTALVRLSDKGYLRSEMAGATKERGGRRKRFYRVTSAGKEALHTARSLRDGLWKSIPNFSIS